jgi:anhydro-N-acetylmuramic acid kinase
MAQDGYYIGLMSGTSMDAVDAAVVNITANQITTLATYAEPLSPELRQQLLALLQPGENELMRMGQLDNQVAELFASTTQKLLQQAQIQSSQIRAIGSHGQTIRHYPAAPLQFSLQIGNPNIIAERTGITTVADFRRRDMAVGGQGAPLVPAFHQQIFHTAKHDRIILNIGGIANVTILPKDVVQPVIGFDTGPGNCLLDSYIQQHFPHLTYDANGEWAATGKIIPTLLQAMLQETYLQQQLPKSTGRELFNLTWLSQHIANIKAAAAPADIQATLLEYTAQTIVQAIAPYATSDTEVLVCGGGSHNAVLLARLTELAPALIIKTTAAYGINPDFVEAIAFAWMAHATLSHQTANLPVVTGADKAVILGGVYFI